VIEVYHLAYSDKIYVLAYTISLSGGDYLDKKSFEPIRFGEITRGLADKILEDATKYLIASQNRER
jgi:hypothetical protein